jgi:peptidyl-prolyl cis-trans isomerase SurA
MAEVIDRVVAEVNDDVITLSELNEEGKDILKLVAKQASPGELEASLQTARREILSRLIDRKITVQQAEKMNISVTESEIDTAIQRIIIQNNATEETFKRELAAIGISEESYRSSIREQILHSKLTGYEVYSKIVITEEKAREYYENNYMRTVEPSSFYLLQMGFRWSEQINNSKENARQKATQARDAAMSGQSFRHLAMNLSDLPSAAEGGDIGLINEKEMAPEMYTLISSLGPGEISPVVEAGSTYIFFKLLAANKEGTIVRAPFESVKQDIIGTLRDQEQEKLYTKWVQKLREDAYIKELL